MKVNMPIRITIGNAELEYRQTDSHVGITVNEITCDDAPDFTDKSNNMQMSYLECHDWIRGAGVISYMNGIDLDISPTDNSFADSGRDSDGIIEIHPCQVTIDQRDVDFWHGKVKAYRAMNPDVQPGFDNTRDYILARMMWFEFWVQWAVKNCEMPVIANE